MREREREKLRTTNDDYYETNTRVYGGMRNDIGMTYRNIFVTSRLHTGKRAANTRR